MNTLAMKTKTTTTAATTTTTTTAATRSTRKTSMIGKGKTDLDSLLSFGSSF